MSNITIYHPLLAQDTELRLKTEEILGIIQQGNALRLQLAMKLAEQYELISAKSRRAHKGELQEIMCELYGIKRSTYFEHVKAGRIYLAEPDKRNLGIKAVLAKPTDLQTSPAFDAELDALVGQAKACIAEVERTIGMDMAEEIIDAMLDETLKDDVEYLRSELKELRERVKNLRDEVDFLKEERDDLRGWLDSNTRAKAAGVYDQLKRLMLN